MSDRLRVFWSEPTDRVRVSLRRFMHTPVDGDPPNPNRRRCANAASGYCEESVVIVSDSPAVEWIDEDSLGAHRLDGVVEHTDPRWPKECASCGVPFAGLGEWQVNAHRLYAGGGHLFTLHKPAPGAMYDAHWLGEHCKGWDGINLCVILPNSFPWLVDSEASNCTRPGDRSHRCWVRHGNPKSGEVHVDKSGKTCDAGGGSIGAWGWHGYLHHGWLHT